MPTLSPAISTPAWLYAHARAALDARDIHLASQLLNEAQAAGADVADCAALRWQCSMLLGEYESAWRESDRIDRLGAPDPHRFWDCLPLDGRRVILRCLHGFGDALQFSRYAPMLRNAASQLTIEAHPKLAPLFHRQRGWGEVIAWGENAPTATPTYDAQVEVMELPRIFRIFPTELPVQPPYLRADTCASVLRMFEHHPASPRIGLCWAASEWDARRSMRLSALKPLLNVLPSVVYSVQWGAERAEIQTEKMDSRILDTAAAFAEIAATAAVIDQLDLVITVDGMVAHLAGALGKRVWLMLPYAADWRWGLEPRTSAWYPRMTLFRQRAPGDWPDVIETMSREFIHEHR